MYSILILGIGSIGGVVSASLIKSDIPITMVTNNQELTNSLTKNGIIYGSSNLSIPNKVYTNIEEVPKNSKFDFIFYIMKANSLISAIKSSLRYSDEKTYYVTFQNGIVVDEVAKLIDKDKIICVSVGFNAIMTKPNIYNKTTPGGLIVGNIRNQELESINILKDILNNVSRTTVTKNLYGVLWSKLALNCGLNSISAISGLTLGEAMKLKEARNLFFKIYKEVIITAENSGIKLEKTNFNPYFLVLDDNSNRIMKFIKNKLMQIIGGRFKKTKSSTLQSLERKRKTEVDFLNGYVVRKGQEIKLDNNLNRIMVNYIHEIEEGKRGMVSENISQIYSMIIN